MRPRISIGGRVRLLVTQTFKSRNQRPFHPKSSTNTLFHSFYHLIIHYIIHSFIYSFIHKKHSLMKNIHSQRTHRWPTWPCFLFSFFFLYSSFSLSFFPLFSFFLSSLRGPASPQYRASIKLQRLYRPVSGSEHIK